MSSKKILIMASRSQSPEDVSRRDEDSSSGAGVPLSTTNIQTVFTATDIWKILGGLEQSVHSLKANTALHEEKIQQVTRQADETKFSLSILDRAVAIHADRLRGLDNFVYAAKIIASAIAALIVALLVPLITYLYHHITLTFHP